MAKAGAAATPAVAEATGRLAGKIAVITGAAGNLGGHIVRHYLAAGATVVMTGRSAERIEAAAEVVRAGGVDASRVATVVLDGADPQSVRDGIAEVVARFGRIDVLVNNAGSTGPKQPIESLPLDANELAELRKTGSIDTETVGDAVRNLFGVALKPRPRRGAGDGREGGSIINVSTIFSRTSYYARAAYVVPKAAMNAWVARTVARARPAGHSRQPRVSGADRKRTHPHRVRDDGQGARRRSGHKPLASSSMSCRSNAAPAATPRRRPIRSLTTWRRPACSSAATNRPPTTATTSRSPMA